MEQIIKIIDKNTIELNGVVFRAEPAPEAAKPRTGYERVAKGETYYVMDNANYAIDSTEEGDASDDTSFDYAVYVSNEQLANDNLRADTLMRRLRQWQALNDEPVRWDNDEAKYKIIYDFMDGLIIIDNSHHLRDMFTIYFTSKEKVREAIEAFRDELIWYFTGYRQRLDEPTR